ncbi:hypothetical protein CP965_08710 [Halarcobacter mediterraneus]|uniref:diguanylate cyclase n=1 Tax=Halarcobacter mediterraneus TaxID=2023153 RepID=A0A4Q1AVL2_9BACT|nr:GGDEF domain-containing protein [Halarcobacter mediterraneus]RXK12649.1 hypothetical protein CP965_08710 [Halarcobacter mediterraneus]
MSNSLKEVTFLTVKQLRKENIILPGTYSQVFENNAKELKVDLEDQNVIFKDLKQDCDSIDNVVKKTNENLNTLHNSTSKAKVAIENNDTRTLEHIKKELDKMKEQISYLQKELFSDNLTGAYNRKWFMDIYLSNDRFIHDGFMAFIDLNKFKSINDSYGHLVGDQVLKYLVNFLRNEIESDDMDIVRYAGDEFIILFNKDKCSVLNADKKVYQAQEKLSQQKLKSSKIDSLSFSFSYGLVPFKRNDNFEDILNKVDELMYKNKKEFK